MLARPIYVHTDHIAPMACPHGCLGVELDNHKNLHAHEFRGCAVCELPGNRAVLAETRTLRQCSHRLCHGRFHQTSYDEFRVGERLNFKKTISRVTAVFTDGAKS